MLKITPSKKHYGMKPNQSYIIENTNAGEVMIGQDCSVENVNYTPFKSGDGFKSVLVVRPGGFGDLMFLNPVLEAMKEREPNLEITVSAVPIFAKVMNGNSAVSELIPYPIKEEDFYRFESVLWLENTVEFSEDAKNMHPVDLWLKCAGIDPDEVPDKNKGCKLWLTDADKGAAARFPKNPTVKRLGMQMKASASCRTPSNFGPVIKRFHEAGWEILFFGAPDEVNVKSADPRLINVTTAKPSLSFHESCAVMKTCDLFIAPDSGLLHAAASLGVPSVGMYGPFPGDLRCKYSPSVTVIEGDGACAPCFWHARLTPFPAHCPTAKQGRCKVLDSIDPLAVFDAGKEVSK